MLNVCRLYIQYCTKVSNFNFLLIDLDLPQLEATKNASSSISMEINKTDRTFPTNIKLCAIYCCLNLLKSDHKMSVVLFSFIIPIWDTCRNVFFA